MWRWGIIVILGCVLVYQLLRFRKERSLWQVERSSLCDQLDSASQALTRQEALANRQDQSLQTLTEQLAEKEDLIARLRSEVSPTLSPTASEDSSPQAEVFTVYFNENTGIYHMDRACAPYQAISIPLADLEETARPCKKCAEGRLPSPTALEAPTQEDEDDQMCLF